MTLDEARVLSPAVVAEDLAALAEVLGPASSIRRLLERAADLVEQVDTARAREQAVRDLPPKWDAEQAAYPIYTDPRAAAAAAAVRLCSRELRAALGSATPQEGDNR